MANVLSTSTSTSAAHAEPREPRYVRVYVWQRPIRIAHWTFVASLTVLFLSGLFISWPTLTGSGEAYDVFVMARARQLHFIAGYVFAVAYVWRFAWFVLGNRHARSGFPYVWRPSWWRDLRRQALDYLRFDFGTPHLGHNALAGLSYTVFVIGVGAFQILTGFALYGESNPGGFWDSLCGWAIPLLGGSARTHMWHHLASWIFLTFVVLHVYIVMLDARQYRNGLLVSMITGMKFRKEDQDDEPDA